MIMRFDVLFWLYNAQTVRYFSVSDTMPQTTFTWFSQRGF